jgi:voltage-gated potassium channel
MSLQSSAHAAAAEAAGTVVLPKPPRSPAELIGARVAIAMVVLIAVSLIVYADRDGYTDNADGAVSLLDAFYYATVSLSTTGYGDIAPVTPQARLVNILIITPLRILFLIVLVGTTLEALTSRSREAWKVTRWRRTLQDHTVVIGFGVKGRAAVRTLLINDTPRSSIVVVDPDATNTADAIEQGLVSVVGDATRLEVLSRAGIERAGQVIICPQRDDTAVLVTLTARSANPKAHIVVSVREEENAPLLRSSGADAVITSSESVGRLLGLASVSPALSTVLEDLLSSGHGMEVGERRVLPREEGRTPAQLDEPVLAVVRDGEILPYYAPSIGHLTRGDRIVVARPSEDLPWARRVTDDDVD